jgi:hypothetical protein
LRLGITAFSFRWSGEEPIDYLAEAEQDDSHNQESQCAEHLGRGDTPPPYLAGREATRTALPALMIPPSTVRVL